MKEKRPEHYVAVRMDTLTNRADVGKVVFSKTMVEALRPHINQGNKRVRYDFIPYQGGEKHGSI